MNLFWRKNRTKSLLIALLLVSLQNDLLCLLRSYFGFLSHCYCLVGVIVNILSVVLTWASNRWNYFLNFQRLFQKFQRRMQVIVWNERNRSMAIWILSIYFRHLRIDETDLMRDSFSLGREILILHVRWCWMISGVIVVQFLDLNGNAFELWWFEICVIHNQFPFYFECSLTITEFHVIFFLFNNGKWNLVWTKVATNDAQSPLTLSFFTFLEPNGP